MTLTAPERPKLDTGDSLLHGAHLDCQQDRPTVKAVCGVECDWDEMNLTRNDSRGTPLRATPADRAQLARERLDAYCRDCHARNEHGDA